MDRMVTVAILIAAQVLIGAQYAYAVTPVTVPEPASLILLGVGAGALGVGAWWRSRRK